MHYLQKLKNFTIFIGYSIYIAGRNYTHRCLDFIQLITLLKKLPRKKLARSSSNPTNFTRFAKFIF